MIFKFPESLEDYQTISSIQDLRNSLNSQAKSNGLKSLFFNILQLKSKYIYLKCRKCSAHLRYRKQEAQFILLKFNNTHNHISSIQQNSKILSFMRELPHNIKTSCAKTLIKREFQIKDSKFYYLFNKLKNHLKNFEEFLSQLDKQGFQLRYIPFPLPTNTIPELCLIISMQMRSDYLTYGQSMSFDVTYNLIKERSNGRQYGVGIFGGKNSFNHVVIFGIALLLNENTESMCCLFKNFIEVMGQPPETILSDQQNSIAAALRILADDEQWQGNHLLDCWHLLKNLKKNLRGSEQLYRQLKLALMSDDTKKVQKTLHNVKRLIKNERQARVVHEFQDKMSRTCFSLAPKKFIGFGISTSFAQKINDLIKTSIEYQHSVVPCLNKIINLSNNLHNNATKYRICRVKYEDIFNNNQLKQLRFTVADYVFEKIVANYARGLQLKPRQSAAEDQWIFINQDRQVQARVSIKQKMLVCNCGYRAKTLTPCIHELNLIHEFRETLVSYIGKRWLIQTVQNKRTSEDNARKDTQRRGRPSFSRRNMVK